MATRESMAIRSNAACERIEQKLAQLGVEIDPLLRVHKDREMLRMLQLLAIADALESIPVQGGKKARR